MAAPGVDHRKAPSGDARDWAAVRMDRQPAYVRLERGHNIESVIKQCATGLLTVKVI